MGPASLVVERVAVEAVLKYVDLVDGGRRKERAAGRSGNATGRRLTHRFNAVDAGSRLLGLLLALGERGRQRGADQGRDAEEEAKNRGRG